MKSENPKQGKKEIFYDILSGEKKYYVGRMLTYPDGRRKVQRLTGVFPSRAEAERNK